MQSWLSTNSTTPLWLFFVIAVLSMFVTTFVVLFLKWMEKGWLKSLSRRVLEKFFKMDSGKPRNGDEKVLKVDSSLPI